MQLIQPKTLKGFRDFMPVAEITRMNLMDKFTKMFFKRKDGQIDKSVDIFERIMPIIMKERNDALVYIKKEVPFPYS